MHDIFKRLQGEYLEALRPVIAEALSWWSAHCPYPHTEPRSFEEKHPFHRRWIAGPVGHPRVLAVFREFFFRVQELNERSAGAIHAGADEPPSGDVAAVWVPRERPIDVLVNDLETVAPDLYEVMQGLVYVPIGMDPGGQEC